MPPGRYTVKSSDVKKKLFALYLKVKHWLLRRTRDPYLMHKFRRCQKKAVQRLKGKEKLRCVFFALNDTVWKYDYVFRRMMADERFEPIILVCPHTGYGFQYMKEMMERTTAYFSGKNYPFVASYDFVTNRYVDVRKELNPDIIFYCIPYAYNIDKRYYISRYPDKLTVYVPYAFNNSADWAICYDELLHNLVWRYYVDTEEYRKYSVPYSRCGGDNVVVTGYPGIEIFLDDSYKASMKDWKIQDDNSLKRIIWAPHHTIEDSGTIIYSCFLQYCEFMPAMARKYADKVQFVLKPHPLLRVKLEKYWGKEKTAAYFDEWTDMPNASFTEGNYVDIFKTCDAMIHDCGSFIGECLYLNKPVMRMMNGYPLEQMYNGLAQRCIDNHYKAFCEKDVEDFILMVIEGKDPMLDARTEFIRKELMPEGMPSQNIIDDIVSSVYGQR